MTSQSRYPPAYSAAGQGGIARRCAGTAASGSGGRMMDYQAFLRSKRATVEPNGITAIRLGRKFVGVELKASYFNVAARNLEAAESLAHQGDMFSLFAQQ